MSLFARHGPHSATPAGRWNVPMPSEPVYVEPFARRVRGLRSGQVIVDTEEAVLVHRAGRKPALAFPSDDLQPGVGRPADEVPGHVYLDADEADTWFEEDDELAAGTPRNPYHRVDCLATSRRLRVEIDGTVLVDTRSTIAVYETSLTPVLYVPPSEVRPELLVPSSTTTFCPYKGTAAHYTAVIGDTVVDDVAWAYPDPRLECQGIAGFLAFYGDRAEVSADLPRST